MLRVRGFRISRVGTMMNPALTVIIFSSTVNIFYSSALVFGAAQTKPPPPPSGLRGGQHLSPHQCLAFSNHAPSRQVSIQSVRDFASSKPWTANTILSSRPCSRWPLPARGFHQQTLMTKEDSKGNPEKLIHARFDRDDEAWEKWKTQFAGKFVLKTGTATGTSRRAAVEAQKVDGEVLIMERGRALSFDEEMQYGDGINDVYQLDDDEDGEEPLKQVLGAEKMVIVHFDQGRVKVKVRCPADKLQVFDLACDAVGENTDDYIPYWVEVWPSALALGDFITEAGNIKLRGTNVLEISAGIGVPGLTALVVGAKRVHLTEFDPAALAIIEASAASIRAGQEDKFCPVETSIFDWFRPTGHDIMTEVDTWDVVLLADVMYEARFVKPVATAVASLLKNNKGCKALFSDPQRASLQSFIEQLKTLNLEVEKHQRTIKTLVCDVGGELKEETHSITILSIEAKK